MSGLLRKVHVQRGSMRPRRVKMGVVEDGAADGSLVGRDWDCSPDGDDRVHIATRAVEGKREPGGERPRRG